MSGTVRDPHAGTVAPPVATDAATEGSPEQEPPADLAGDRTAEHGATGDAVDVGGLDFRDPHDREYARRIGRAWIELRRGVRTTELRDYLYGDAQLEQGQMDALDLLVRRDRTMSGLAERLRIDPSTATRAVQRMVDAGLVERVPSPDDGRRVVVRPTATGRETHSSIAARRSLAMGRLLAAFDPDERAILADLLDRFVDALDDVVTTLH